MANSLNDRRDNIYHMLHNMLVAADIDLYSANIIDIWHIFQSLLQTDFNHAKHLTKEHTRYNLYLSINDPHAPPRLPCCMCFTTFFELNPQDIYDGETWDIGFEFFYNCSEREFMERNFPGNIWAENPIESETVEDYVLKVEAFEEFQLLKTTSVAGAVKIYIDVHVLE